MLEEQPLTALRLSLTGLFISFWAEAVTPPGVSDPLTSVLLWSGGRRVSNL